MADWASDATFQSVCELLKEKHDRPGAIKNACRKIEDCLVSNKDNLRGFFEHCFPLLLKRIFGYDDKEASWLYLVSAESRSEDATALIQLLAPTGQLFSALHAADGDQLIQFLFPPERLPAHTQELLRLPAGRIELDTWPQYHGRLRLDGAGRCQVHLNMFEYCMFWAAFYVLRAGRATDKSGKGNGSSRVRTFKLWTNAPSASGGDSSKENPYFKLLRLYLEFYLPRPASISPLGNKGLGSSGGGRGSTGGSSRGLLAGLSGTTSYGSLLQATPGEVLLSVLLEFWLTDPGEPLPAEPQPAAGSSRAGSPTGQLLKGNAAVGPGGLAPGLVPGASSTIAAAAAAGVGGWSSSQAGSLAVSGPGGVSGPGSGLGYNGAGYSQSGGFGVLGGDPLSQQGFMVNPAAAAVAGGLGGFSSSGAVVGSDRLSSAAGAGVLPAGAAAAGGGTGLLTYSYQAPADELVEALTSLVKYIYVGEPPTADAPPTPAQTGPKWLPNSPIGTLPLPSGRLALPHQASPLMAYPVFSPAVQAVSRKLYRFLRRTFAQWQPSSSVSIAPITKLWLAIICPWQQVKYKDTLSLMASIDSLTGGGQQQSARSSGRQSPGGGSSSNGARLAALRGAAEGAAQLLHTAGAAAECVISPTGQHRGMLSGAGHAAATAGAALHRWGSEMAHRVPGAQDDWDQQTEPRGSSRQLQKYTSAWRPHVLAHLPFYTQLLPAFLELVYSQMAYNAKAAQYETYRVMKALSESGQELIQELRQAEAAYNKYTSSSLRRPEGDLAELLPWLADQSVDWEAAAAAGAQTTPPIVPDTRYRMFTLEQGGAPSCMRALLAAQDRQKMSAREKVRNHSEQVLPLSELSSEEAAMPVARLPGRDLPKAGNWRELRYHGDWMLRPIASNEIAWLVRLLVASSRSTNTALGLTGVPTPPGDEPPETVMQELLGFARRRGWRVNLRPLAEMQTLAWLTVLFFITRWIWALVTSEGGLFGLGDEQYQAMGGVGVHQRAGSYQHHRQPHWQQRL